MSEQLRFQSVLITGQQQQVYHIPFNIQKTSRLPTQTPASPNNPIENLAYSSQSYYIQNNLPVDYETQKQISYTFGTANINPIKTSQQITAKHTATQKISVNQKKSASQKKLKKSHDSDSENDSGVFCGVRTETQPKSIQIDLPTEQTTRSDSEYGVCQIF